MTIFKNIELSDKPLFDRYLQARHYENSEFTFTNLFIWRLSYNFKFAVIHDHLCIIGKYRKLYPSIFVPLSIGTADYGAILPVLADYMHEKAYPLILKSVPEKEMLDIKAVLNDKVLFREDRNNSDYVYLSQELKELKGRKFRQKRNHINRFKKNYPFEYEEMSADNLQECLLTELKWVSERDGDRSILEEKQAIGEIINNFDALNVSGGVIRINGAVQAFTIGEKLNPDMAVIHIEKANTDYDGSYAIINQIFVSKALSDLTYINREEDMGIAGLRKAKESYNPVKMVKKYTGFYSEKGEIL
ncbi:MAG: phosphatidylglycerol lysyltransferase domain-containing protein [Clostridia bacterium]|nr:phosphatidylglycerol lysyltransferase domain-containing protein [Clostridia bacterium]MDD4679606.1 phosphatidylglycerol lysyltransferase domain-containing protein [Clostridia bacterium]